MCKTVRRICQSNSLAALLVELKTGEKVVLKAWPARRVKQCADQVTKGLGMIIEEKALWQPYKTTSGKGTSDTCLMRSVQFSTSASCSSSEVPEAGLSF